MASQSSLHRRGVGGDGSQTGLGGAVRVLASQSALHRRGVGGDGGERARGGTTTAAVDPC